MDANEFDSVIRRLATGRTRRGVLRGLLAGGVAVAIGGTAMEAEAGKRCKKAGAPCSGNKQCCPKETKRVCKVPTGGSSSDTFCCGGVGAKCGGVGARCGGAGAKCGGANANGDAVGLLCCANFRCSTGDPDDPNFVPRKPGVCQRG